MLSGGMCDKPIEISQGSLSSLRVAVSSPQGGEEGRVRLHVGYGEARTLPEFLYQCHLEVGDQVTGHT